MKPWHLGNTTVRSPFRLREGLVALSTSSLQGNLRGSAQDMPPELQAHFMAWLEQQPLSISRPPLGLPSRGQAYFAEDVLTAMDSVPH